MQIYEYFFNWISNTDSTSITSRYRIFQLTNGRKHGFCVLPFFCSIANLAFYRRLIYVYKKKDAALSASFGGKTGIRTLGPGKLVNGFRDRPDRPLRHLSLKNRILQRFLLKNSSVFGLQRYKLFLICKDFFIFLPKKFGSGITFLQLALLFQWSPRLTPCPAGRDLVDLAESADSSIA